MFKPHKLDTLTTKWWFYLLILIVLFLPSYTTRPFNPQDTPILVEQVLRDPIIYNYPILFILSKIITLVLIISIAIVYRKNSNEFIKKYLTIFFVMYTAILLLAIAIFQNMSATTDYGFAVLTGNLFVMLIIATFWINEFNLFKSKNIDELSMKKETKIRWLIPLAILAFWYPVNTVSAVPKPDLSLINLINNESVLTFCMITPIILTIAILYFPSIHLSTLRVTSYVGLILGLINMISWFAISPEAWWMGVLHFPLVIISFYVFIVSIRKV